MRPTMQALPQRPSSPPRAWLALAAALLGMLAWLPALAGAAAPGPWVSAWMAAPQRVPQGPGVPAYRQPPPLREQTLREIVVPQLSGERLRVRISNRYGDRPLRIGAATVGLVAHDAALRADSLHVLRFDGHAQVLIAPHCAMWSDPLDAPVHAGRALAISLYLPQAAVASTWHVLAGQVQFVSARGDHAADPGGGAFAQRMTSWLWLDRVDVGAGAGAGALLAIGDSITDGMRSTLNARRSWPQQLGVRLRADGVEHLAVLNAGISGNRLLSDSACWGDSLESRFARDALQPDGVRAVVLLIGINDIDFAATPPRQGLDCDAPHRQVHVARMEQALARLAALAHARGLRVYGATLTPADLPPSRESQRLRLDAWIRSSHDFDGVIDFDAALRDPRQPSRMLPRLDSGDHLHPSDAGYAAMAAAALPVALREARPGSSGQP